MYFFTSFHSFSLKSWLLCLTVALEARHFSQVGPQDVARGLSLLLRFCSDLLVRGMAHLPAYSGAEMSTYGGHCQFCILHEKIKQLRGGSGIIENIGNVSQGCTVKHDLRCLKKKKSVATVNQLLLVLREHNRAEPKQGRKGSTFSHNKHTSTVLP